MTDRSQVRRAALSAAAFLGAASLAAPAAAQGVSLDRFDPAPAGDRMFGVESPYVAGNVTPHGMLLFEYARNPLVLRNAQDQRLGAVVSDQLFAHANASLALFHRLNLNLDVPVALAQHGDSPDLGAAVLVSPGAAQMGDLRLGARVRIFGDYEDAFQLAVGGYAWLPTAPSTGYVGDGAVRWLPEVILGGHTDHLVWSFTTGPRIGRNETFDTQPASADAALPVQGTLYKINAGAGVLLGPAQQVQLGLEGGAAIQTARGGSASGEVLLDLRLRFLRDFEAGVAAGPGIGATIGTPTSRFVAMLAYSPSQRDRDHDGIVDSADACPDVPGERSRDPGKNGCPPPKPPGDRDHDGITDDVDACPDEPGRADPDPRKNGCPVRDRDGDRIPDDVDACPDEPGRADPDPKKNGCPVRDRDGDGIPDDVDACPDVKGVPSTDPRQNGCPPDTDGDGIRDDLDACPLEKGPPSENPKTNGCPLVSLRENEIVISEQVHFDTAKATIRPVSNPLLDRIAQVIQEHPELLVIEVRGHTDSIGLPASNKRLSDARAEAVRRALLKRGVAAKRVRSKGFGDTVPLADNGTEAGRTLNRRVELKIVEKKPAGKK